MSLINPSAINVSGAVRRYTPLHSADPSFKEVGDPIYYDWETKTFFYGETLDGKMDTTYPLWNIEELALAKQRIKSAAVEDTDPIGTELTGVNQGLYPKAQEVLYQIKQLQSQGVKGSYNERIKNAAILKREDFTALKTILPQTRIIAAKPRKHALLDIFTIDNTPDFLTKIYSWDGPFDMVQENLAELNIPKVTGFPSFTPITIPMQRNAIHYAFSEEFLSETFDFNVQKFMVDNVSGQMDIVFNKKIADMLNNDLTYTAYGDWTAKTGNYSNRDPAADLAAEAEKIWKTEKNEGIVVASSRKTFNAYQGNTNNNNFGTPNFTPQEYSFGNGRFTGIPRQPGLEWYVDTFMTEAKLAVIDPSAVYVGRMPQRIVDYQSQYGTHRGTIIRQNFISQIIDQSRMLGASGITT